uniref:RNA-dependent RNA polymerase n=1 Tax=Riboviria sp. TaxID=2585031 RepID=A0A514D6S0_9VIRU|nr:MAG: RNA-dependent RNA polymerase [Riboviria sp.]
MAKFLPQETIRVDKDLMDEYFATCDPSKARRLLEALDGAQWNSEMDTKHVFAKQEVLLKDHKAQPRVVYQGTDMYNALTGPVVMELNNRMKEIFSLRNPLNTGNIALYACGMKGEEMGEIMEQARGNPIESDAKNNDGSQSKEFRKYEAMFYRKLGAPDWFVREFARTLKVRVWTRYGICAEVSGERWSGETTTTTGNSYVHMALIQAAHERAEIKNSTNIHGGDDYLGYVEGDELKFKDAVEKVFDDSGMVAEVVPQTARHYATFYRKRYVRGTIGTRPVPQFGGGRDNVQEIVSRSLTHVVTDFNDFLQEVYGINYDDLFDCYERVCQSCVDYCDGFTYVGKDGKTRNKKNNSKYIAPKMSGDTIEALVRLDVN